MEKYNPLVSIITVCFNSEKTIRRAIESVSKQSYENIEYIIIDGSSTDRTVNIISEYKDIISYFISEKDNGIAEAWNKGIKVATGEIIGILNSDDFYKLDTVNSVVNAFINNGIGNKIIYGECRLFDEEGIKVTNKKKFDRTRISKGFGFVHTTCFLSHDIYKKVGLFSTKYKIAVDTDFLLRCVKEKVEFVQGEHIVYMALGGVSDKYAIRAFKEYLNALFDHEMISSKKKHVLFTLYKAYYWFRPALKSKAVNILLRKFKHYLIELMNFLYQILPSLFIKRQYLKLLGMSIGKKSQILKGCTFYQKGNFTIGMNSIINRNCLIDNRGLVSIGNNVSISHCCKIYTGGHDINSPFFDYIQKNVKIENNVVIFSNSIIQPGVILSEGCVVLPGSVVTKNVGSYKVVGGNPAKTINKRDSSLQYELSYPFWYAL